MRNDDNRPNENVSMDDVKATAKAKLDEVGEAANEKKGHILDKLKELSVDHKIVLMGAISMGFSIIVNGLSNRGVSKVEILDELEALRNEMDQVLSTDDAIDI